MKKQLALLVVTLLFIPVMNATEASKKIRLNNDWQFRLGELSAPDVPKKIMTKAGFAGGASVLTREEGAEVTAPGIFAMFLPDEDALYGFFGICAQLTDEWEVVNLPHDWKFRQAYKEPAGREGFGMDSDAGSGYLPDNIAYYRKRFAVSEKSEKQRVFLEFEGVMHDCNIWVNGHYVGAHTSGYTGFDFDVTEYLNYGSDKNIVLVKTSSYGREGWWYEGAGIYRNVWLSTRGTLGFKRDGVFVQTFPTKTKAFDINLVSEITNQYAEQQSFLLSYEIIDPKGKTVYNGKEEFTIPALSEADFNNTFHIEQPILWDLDQPNLYQAKTSLYRNGVLEDENYTRFGLRTIDYTQDGLFLNGRWVELKGVCDHQDFAGVGVALTEDILEYKVQRFKDMGVNAYRSSHHAATQALLDICDREGVLVLNENRNFSANPETIEDLKELVRSSRNHPSVFMYCLENEEMITPTPQGKALLVRIKELIKKLDPTRMITMAGMAAKDDPNYVTIPDVAGFNYDQNDAANHLKNIPGLRVMGTEDASFISTRGVYTDDPENAWCSAYDSGSYHAIAFGGDDEDSEVDKGTLGGLTSHGSLEYAWNHNRKEVPALGGLFLWTAMDYRGEPAPYYWPSIGCNYGAMDMCGFAKDAFYYWKSVWTNKPMTHLLPYWYFPGKEGQSIKVETYSNCDELELFVNKVSQGKKKTAKGAIERWEVTYQPGEIQLVGYKEGKPVAESVRKTFGNPVELRLETVWAGKEMTLIKVAAYDDKGLLCENCNDEVHFSVSKGAFVGVGNGNPSSHEPDDRPQRKLFNGLALLIVRHANGEKPEVSALINEPDLNLNAILK